MVIKARARGNHCDNGRDKVDGNPRANHTTKCIDTHSQMDAYIHTTLYTDTSSSFQAHTFARSGWITLSVRELRGDNDWW